MILGFTDFWVYDFGSGPVKPNRPSLGATKKTHLLDGLGPGNRYRPMGGVRA